MEKTDVIAARAYLQTRHPGFPLPQQSYLIFMIPRTGSNLLTTHLQQIEFGNPIESFHFNHKRIQRQHGWDIDFSDTPAFLSKAIEYGTASGVFGTKMNWYQLQTFLELARQLTASQYPSLTEKDLLDVFFPNARIIYMKRLDKIKQAISFSKGKQTGIWAVRTDQSDHFKQYVLPPKYNRDHIEGCLEELLAYDVAWENFLHKNQISYLKTWYETLAKDFVNEVSRIHAHLGIEQTQRPQPIVRKLANETSEEWGSRFQAETPWLKQPIIAESLASGDFKTAYIHRSMAIISEKEERSWRTMPSNRFKPVRKFMLRVKQKATSLLKPGD